MRPKKLGWLWLTVWDGLFENAHKEAAWPYVVNDVLLGLEWGDQNELQLYQRLTEMETKERYDLLARLEALPALQEKQAPDLFQAPAPLLYPVHHLLLRSSYSAEHGPLLLGRFRAAAAPAHHAAAEIARHV